MCTLHGPAPTGAPAFEPVAPSLQNAALGETAAIGAVAHARPRELPASAAAALCESRFEPRACLPDSWGDFAGCARVRGLCDDAIQLFPSSFPNAP